MSGWDAEREDDVGLAAEYVLGLLDPAERSAAEDRLVEDPAFREMVRDWTEHFAALAEDIAPVTPPRDLQERVTRRLFPDERPAGLLQRLGVWPWLLGGLAAAGLAILALGPNLWTAQGTPDLTARIAAEDDSLVVQAAFDRETGRLEVERTAGTVPEGRDLELWLVHVDDNSTTSLGVLPRDAAGVIEVRADLIPQFEDNALAVSIEPLGGSPTGQATGPVVAIGPITGL
ncbi:anti-sigma factor [Rubellimicrobium arenae]|uniref:anti-sigma factor n=1 Tax=Rubellimicrobium arenae TaxID=2817372 RepID=UPI001B30898E|nr:anti-sigma factor [Rubellimicrobium arenae]